MKISTLLITLLICSVSLSIIQAQPPLGLFNQYDINVLQKKPTPHNSQLQVFSENSIKVKGFATDSKEEETYKVNPLAIYERSQNFMGIYQSASPSGLVIDKTDLKQLLDSVTGGLGGGVILSNDIQLEPTACLSIGQCSFSYMYGISKGFFVSAYMPVYYASLSNLKFNVVSNSQLFSDFVIQQKIVSTFIQDAHNFFDLDIKNWKQHGIGDVTILAEWQRIFPQMRHMLKSVEANIRVGLGLPTGKAENTRLLMPIAFGNEGAWSIPFGGGLTINLDNLLEFGFAGQFEYIFSNETNRRIKTFGTQTSLLYPTVTKTHKEFAIIQNLSLHATIYSRCNRFSIKNVYTYYRKPSDTLTPLSPNYNFTIANSAEQLNETTLHQYCIFARYTPQSKDFKRVFPQLSIFYKNSFNGMRIAAASTYGIELSVIF